MRMPLVTVLMSLLSLVLLSACPPENTENNAKSRQDIVRLGMVPFETGEELLKDMQPLIEVIENGMDMEVQAIVAADYTGVVEALRGGQLDVAFLSPASYVLAEQEADVRIIAKSQREGRANYYGAIIVRKDSDIHTLQDLKNKTFAFGDPLSTSGHIFARKMMLEAGIEPERDLKQFIYAGSHDSTILSVLNGKVDAGATYADDTDNRYNAWKRFLQPRDQGKIRVLKYTEAIPSDNICVSKDYPEELTQRLQKTILDYSASPEGQKLFKKIYNFDGYVPATDADYASVRAGFEAAGMNLKESLKKKG